MVILFVGLRMMFGLCFVEFDGVFGCRTVEALGKHSGSVSII